MMESAETKQKFRGSPRLVEPRNAGLRPRASNVLYFRFFYCENEEYRNKRVVFFLLLEGEFVVSWLLGIYIALVAKN